MKPADRFAAVLLSLLREGHLPSSRIRGRNRDRLKSLLASGILMEEKKGAGRRIVVRSPAHLQVFIEENYPSGLEEAITDNAPGASGIAMARDSKRRLQRDMEPVLLRGSGSISISFGESSLPVGELTGKFGAASFMNDGNPGARYEGDLATVENLELFTHFFEISPRESLAVYTGGRCSGLLLKWLASPGMRRCQITHYGDWDPVGLDEYLRIRSACPGRTSLYLPEDLEGLFRKYGNRNLIEGNASLTPRIRNSSDPAVVRVVSLINRFNAGLEQEALLIRR